jgi:hypothetical protein
MASSEYSSIVHAFYSSRLVSVGLEGQLQSFDRNLLALLGTDSGHRGGFGFTSE